MDALNDFVLEIAGWLAGSFDDGPMVRTVLFLQGCSRTCPGCHNAKTHAHGVGTFLSVSDIVAEAKRRCRNRHITSPGGEPLEQLPALRQLLRALQREGFDICLYTGWEMERVPQDLLPYLSYLKTGHFVAALRQADLQYVGSANQHFYRVENGVLVPIDIGAAA